MISIKEKSELREVIKEQQKIEGFPISEISDLIRLADPPLYTPYPNNNILKFINDLKNEDETGRSNYDIKPFHSDVSEGKNERIYNAHSYHTKVPHKAIMRYILHYTNPGDVIFDGFCGTGMTGVASQECGSPDPEFKRLIEKEMPNAKWGSRKTILIDLSPAATFIAYNYTNSKVNKEKLIAKSKEILDTLNEEFKWLLYTNHVINGKIQKQVDVLGNKQHIRGKINFIIWSDIFICPNCSQEIVFWKEVDKSKGKQKNSFFCSNCNFLLNKRNLERAYNNLYDPNSKKVKQVVRQTPVLINYSIKNKRYSKEPDTEDNELFKKIEEYEIPDWYPRYKIMFKGTRWGDTWRAGVHAGITTVDELFLKYNLIILAGLHREIFRIRDKQLRNPLLWAFNAILEGSSKLNRERPHGLPSKLSGTLYVSSMIRMVNPLPFWSRKVKLFIKLDLKNFNSCIIGTQSSTSLNQIPNESIDYIFTDPPFGDNLMYSELNFIWESWLRIHTNNEKEIIINKSQNKDLLAYQNLMELSFKENYRILKPGRWMTVEFHNSKNKIWIAIQEALMKSGFIIADVKTLDKKQGSFKQVTSRNAVKQDLVITTYKPQENFISNFKLKAGSIDGVWEFVQEHLFHLPIISAKRGKIEVISERQNYLIYDRMVAYHVQNGISVPISASEFYIMLAQKFPERDDMYFLPNQVLEYEKERLKSKGFLQTYLFVIDEKSGIQWLRKELKDSPQTYQEIQPKFLQNLVKLKHERLPELLDLLKENFLIDKQDKWFFPDPNKQADLEKVREKGLIKEFQTYVSSKGKLKQFRIEAVRAGFRKAWSEQDYKLIVNIGERLPSTILQEDDSLLMYYDNASIRLGE